MADGQVENVRVLCSMWEISLTLRNTGELKHVLLIFVSNFSYYDATRASSLWAEDDISVAHLTKAAKI